jgi:hypothetical protein
VASVLKNKLINMELKRQIKWYLLWWCVVCSVWCVVCGVCGVCGVVCGVCGVVCGV